MRPTPRSLAPRPTPSTASSAAAGFTLMEVMVALSIMAMIMVALYSTLDTSLATRDQLEYETRAARMGPALLDVIEKDLRRAWVYNIEDDKVFLGQDHTVNGEQADTLVFLTTVDSTITQRIGAYEVPSDIAETGYRLKANPDFTDLLELWRRQDYHVDEEPLEGGVYERLHDRVISFQLRYVDTIERSPEWLDDWDAGERHRLPAAVLVDLVLEVGPRAGNTSRAESGARTMVYQRFIPLHAGTDVAMRVHPLVPAFLGAASGSGGGGAGGGPGLTGDVDGESPDGSSGNTNEGGPGGPGGPDTGGGGDLTDFLDELLGGD